MQRKKKERIPYTSHKSKDYVKMWKELSKVQRSGQSKTTLTLRHFRTLTKVNAPADPINTKGVVCRIACNCGRVYVGETGRKLNQRITQHEREHSHEC